MVDLRAQPLPQGLLQEYIQAKSQTPLSSAVGGANAGISRGLQLTEEISKIKKQKEVQELTGQVMASPEFQEADQEFKGLLGLGMKVDPSKALNEFVDWNRKKQEDDYAKIKTEIEDINKVAKDSVTGYTEEMKTRQKALAQAISTKKYPPEGAYEWTSSVGEPRTIALKKRQIALAEKQDPVMKDLKDQVYVAKQRFDESASEADEETYKSIVTKYQMYWNEKFKDQPNMQFSTFEETEKALLMIGGFEIGTKKGVAPKTLSAYDKEALAWAKANPDAEQAVAIFKRLNVKPEKKK